MICSYAFLTKFQSDEQQQNRMLEHLQAFVKPKGIVGVIGCYTTCRIVSTGECPAIVAESETGELKAKLLPKDIGDIGFAKLSPEVRANSRRRWVRTQSSRRYAANQGIRQSSWGKGKDFFLFFH